MPEDALVPGCTRRPETNEDYAIAKVAALGLVKMHRPQYGMEGVSMEGISLMPTNLYGSGDNFDLHIFHVLHALLAKMHQANVDDAGTIEICGTGQRGREFPGIDGLADAVAFANRHYTGETHLNVGVGEDIPLADSTTLVADVVGWGGRFLRNTDMPDGTPRGLVDVSRLIEICSEARIGLREGVVDTYRWYLEDVAASARR